MQTVGYVLGVAFNTIIKLPQGSIFVTAACHNVVTHLLVRFRGIVEPNLMRNHEAGFGASADDEVTKVTIVPFDIALPRP